MEKVGPVPGNDFDLRARVAAVLRIIADRRHRYCLDRFLIRCQYRGSAPLQTVHTHAIQQVIIGGNTLPVGNGLHLVFGLENLAIGSSRTYLLWNSLRVSVP